MAKKNIKYGTVDFGPDELKDENVTVLISMRLPMTLLKELKRLALNEQYEGRYQVLARDILEQYVAKAPKAKPMSRSEKFPVKKTS